MMGGRGGGGEVGVFIEFLSKSTNKWYHAKVLPKRFHLNGHTIGFP